MMRYDKRTLGAVVCVAAWLLAGACGGTSSSSGSDDDGAAGSENGSGSGGAAGETGNLVSEGSAGEFSVAVPDDTPVTDLSDEDYITVCEAAAEYMLDAAAPALCTAYVAAPLIQSGGPDSQIRAQCTLAVPACVALVASQVNCVPPEEDCPVTVGEMETCVNALGDAGDEVSQAMPACADLTADTVLSDTTSILSPDQIGNCAELQQQCPDIIPIPPDALPIPGAGGAAGTLPAGLGGSSAATAGAGG